MRQLRSERDKLVWAAGFLEGDGSFGRNGRNGARVAATQVNREPLERLRAYFGGNIALHRGPSRPAHWNAAGVWSLAGPRGRELMMRLRPLMSEKRKAQIDEALAPRDYGPCAWCGGPRNLPHTACCSRRCAMFKRHAEARRYHDESCRRAARRVQPPAVV